MDIKSEKLNLIEWLAGINDSRTIQQLKTFQKSSQQPKESTFSHEEKNAIDQGLKSISEEKTHSHESIMKSTKEKFPHLFK